MLSLALCLQSEILLLLMWPVGENGTDGCDEK